MIINYLFKTIRIGVRGLLPAIVLISLIHAQSPPDDFTGSMRLDEHTGLPAALYNVNSRVYSGSPREIAEAFLSENHILLGTPEELTDLVYRENRGSPAGHHVSFSQVYQGIPVMRSGTVVSINHKNRVSMVINGFKPYIEVNTTTSIQSLVTIFTLHGV